MSTFLPDTAPRPRRKRLTPGDKNRQGKRINLPKHAEVQKLLAKLRTAETAQIYRGVWNQDPTHKLLYWLKDKAVVEHWLSIYTDQQQYLWDHVQGLKWLLRLKRLQDLPLLTRRQDIQLQQWLAALQLKKPLIYQDLEAAISKLNEIEAELLAQDATLHATVATYRTQLRHNAPQLDVKLLLRKLRQALRPVERQTGAAWLHRVFSRQRELLAAYWLRPMTPSEIVSTDCLAILKDLMDQGVIEPYEQATRLSRGSAQTCWYLTKQWRNGEARRLKVRYRDIAWRKAGSYDDSQLNHKLLLNDIILAIEAATKHHNCQIRCCLVDDDLHDLLQGESVTLIRRQPKQKAEQHGEVEEIEEEISLRIPDAYFWIETGRFPDRHLLIELDNASESLRSSRYQQTLEMKYLTLGEWCRTGRHKQIWPEIEQSRGIWHLTITTGARERMEKLKVMVEQIAGPQEQDRYWICHYDDITPSWRQSLTFGLLETEIWLRGGHEGYQRLAL